MATTMRAKFRIGSIQRQGSGAQAQEIITMHAVSKSSPYGEDGLDEDNTYARYSPAGSLSLTVANPALIGKFNPGETYYLDFTPVD